MYDARVVFLPNKLKMPKLKAEDIGLGDLIVLEVFVNRYNSEQSPHGKWTSPRGKGPQTDSDNPKWYMAFKLKNVNLLCHVPGGDEDEEADLVIQI